MTSPRLFGTSLIPLKIPTGEKSETSNYLEIKIIHRCLCRVSRVFNRFGLPLMNGKEMMTNKNIIFHRNNNN